MAKLNSLLIDGEYTNSKNASRDHSRWFSLLPSKWHCFWEVWCQYGRYIFVGDFFLFLCFTPLSLFLVLEMVTLTFLCEWIFISLISYYWVLLSEKYFPSAVGHICCCIYNFNIVFSCVFLSRTWSTYLELSFSLTLFHAIKICILEDFSSTWTMSNTYEHYLMK